MYQLNKCVGKLGNYLLGGIKSEDGVGGIKSEDGIGGQDWNS